MLIMCRVCNKSKENTEFYKNNTYKCGYNTICKNCHSERRKEHEEKNKEYYRKYNLEYKKKNHNKLMNNKIKWRRKNGVLSVNSEESKLQKSLRIRGQENPNWKGGLTPFVKLLRATGKYKEWRGGIFKRDNYVCQLCGVLGGKLNAHHVKKFIDILRENKIKTLKEAYMCLGLWEIKNGITYCVSCHTLSTGRCG